jgi:hypothetical protein
MSLLQRRVESGREKHRLGRWLIALTILFAFGLLDINIVAVPARVVSGWEVFAGVVTFVIIAFGVVYTVWKMER